MSLTDQHLADGVLTVTMDDGKVNALGPAMWEELNAALDRATDDDVTAVVIAGRPGRFSGGFDLSVLQGEQAEANGMLRAGFEFAVRMLQFPKPTVAACTGHAVAMGSFLMLSCDFHVGAAGDFRIQANEVAIGLPIPETILALLRHRLTPGGFDRAVALAEPFDPATAVSVGYLDRVVDPADVVEVAQQTAAGLAATLDPSAHEMMKTKIRKDTVAAMEAGIARQFES